MADSDFVFLDGEPVDVGNAVENDFVFAGDQLVSDGDVSDFAFVEGRGVGTATAPDVRWTASEGDTLLSGGSVATDGEALDEWLDSEGTTADVTGGSPTRQDNVLNGNPIVRFDGPNGSDYLDVGPDVLTYEQPFSIVAVPVTIENRFGYTEFVLDQHPNGAEGVAMRYRNSPDVWAITDDAGNSLDSPSSASAPILLTGVFDGGDSELREDGSTVRTGTLQTDLEGVRLGNNTDGDRSMGDLAEVRIYNRNIVESGEVDAIESEVASTWGL